MSTKRRTHLRSALLIAFAASTLAACHEDSFAPYSAAPSNTFAPPTPVPPDGDPVPAEDPVRTATPPPPPVSGGTLLASKDGATAIAADPDRDRVWIVDTKLLTVRGSVELEPGDEPGRGTFDGGGHAWIALRRGGAVVSLDPAAMALGLRIPVCSEPRGIAYDPVTDRLHVVCAGGELVTLAAADGSEVRRIRLERDLRDVIVEGAGLRVSRFRAAEVLSIDALGAVTSRTTPPPFTQTETRAFEPAVAWRMLALPSGGVVTLHQRGLSTPVTVQQPGASYGVDPCTAIVTDALTVDGPASPAVSGGLPSLALAVDLALAPDGHSVAIAAAGNGLVFETELASVIGKEPTFACTGGTMMLPPTASGKMTPTPGTPIAVAYDAGGHLLVQTREPPSVWVFGRGEIPLPGASRRDTGHELFHAATAGGLACASCHPEGREDGRTWIFDDVGKRRTQSVAGGVLETAPLHWDGELADFGAVLAQVLVTRMQGTLPDAPHANAFASWLDALPAPVPPPPLDADAVAKGNTLFYDPTIGCSGCHAGPKLTTNGFADVGTGKAFQIPSLVGVGARAPFMHDGCAATLLDRFGPCGGAAHGSTANLDPASLRALVAFLETL